MYLKAKENVITDALSRVSSLPIPQQDEHKNGIILVHILTAGFPMGFTSVEFRKATAEDTSGLLIQPVINGWPDSRKDCHPLLLDYWTYREEISAENGLLLKRHRFIIPEKLHNRTLHTIHEGHFSIEKRQLKAKESVFWPKITADILQTAQSCKVCQTFSRTQQTEIWMLHKVPQGPWEKIGADVF